VSWGLSTLTICLFSLGERNRRRGRPGPVRTGVHGMVSGGVASTAWENRIP
jgi:hypothetical protein